MSKAKILESIKKNIKIRVDRETFCYEKINFIDKKRSFIEAFKKAGGEVVESIDGFDTILEAEFGVCENGACFIKGYEDRKVYSYHESILIKLNEKDLVDNMHEALKRAKIDDFGIFISGPSKTADIEQSLVIGAHGAKRVFVYFFK